MSLDSALRGLYSRNIKYTLGFSLAEHTTLRIGGRCAAAVFPSTAGELAESLAVLDNAEIRTVVAGRCSNMIFADTELDIAVVFTDNVRGITVSDNRLTCGAGEGLTSLAGLAASNGLCGLEFACGIPGSVGGAIYMNAGAYGGEIKDVALKSLAYDRDSGEIKELTEHDFGYRTSIYKKSGRRLVCTSATLELTYGDAETSRAKMKQLLEARREKQPLEYPSAGSYFKRPEGAFAGMLIERCGLKGVAVGGAQISEKHAGFLINRGNATFNDVMRLEELVVETVLKETGFLLEREVEVVTAESKSC